MSNRNIILFFLLLSSIVSIPARAQLEGVFVETYYVADAIDASFQSETPILEGEVTYRVYLKLASGSKLKEIFGDSNHPFRIISDERFFNHYNGVSFGYNANKSDYEDDTFPLDSYLTLGQLAKQGGRRYFGVPKGQDIDGSFVGGDNNSNGLLVNPSFSLDVADGIDTLNLFIDDFTDFGVADFSTGNDTTIFGSLVADSSFVSNSMKLQCSGVYGVIPDSNYVLIAQLTTSGELSLSINAVVTDSAGVDYTYVSTNVIDADNQVFASFLNYPPACGCTDPNYIEFNEEYSCSEDGACQNLVVLGCMDEFACNYDSSANFDVPSLCCYPGFCQDRDIEEVCPQIKGESFDIDVFPNPAEQYVTLQVISGVESDTEIDITNYNGISVYSERLTNPSLNFSQRIDISSWATGVYHVRVKAINIVQHSILVKL
jgi:hypothetical protein